MTQPGQSDTLVRCTVCGREERVGFGHCLGHGWPTCCGYTMRLERTDADVYETTLRVLEEKR